MSKLLERVVTITACFLIAIVLIGEVVVYTSDYTDYGADVGFDGEFMEYSVSADGSKTYSVIVNDNHSYNGIDSLLVYYDPGYRDNYEDVLVPVGAKELDQEYYVEQIPPTLRYRGVTDVKVVNASELAEELEKDILAGDSARGLVCISGAFPDTVYTGNEGDAIFKWMSVGGSLYWLGNLIGSCYATTDELVPVEDYQQLFFGAECLNVSGPDKAYGEISGYASALSILNSNVKYGVNCSLLPEGTASLAIGFTEGGFSSISLIQYDKGMMCILGGDYSNNQRNDLAQIIASGLGPESEIVSIETGTVTRGTVTGTIQATGENLTTFVYIGGYYPVFCKLFRSNL